MPILLLVVPPYKVTQTVQKSNTIIFKLNVQKLRYTLPIKLRIPLEGHAESLKKPK